MALTFRWTVSNERFFINSLCVRSVDLSNFATSVRCRGRKELLVTQLNERAMCIRRESSVEQRCDVLQYVSLVA